MMKQIMVLVIVWIGLILPPGSLSAQETEPSETKEKIVNTIDRLLENGCCLSDDGKICNVKELCLKKGLTYPVQIALLRIFKREGLLEIWGQNPGMKAMVKITDVKICAMDFGPGPKFKQGDGKTPEGLYLADDFYGSNYGFMWINLDPYKLDLEGKVGNGSSFKLCLDYPNQFDRLKSAALSVATGGEICLHGNCVSAGCISFTNRNFLTVFAFSRHHNQSSHGRIQIHIFPFDFQKNPDLKSEAAKYARKSMYSENQLALFWANLKQAYELFNSTNFLFDYEVEKISLVPGSISADIPVIKTILKEKAFSRVTRSILFLTLSLKIRSKISRKTMH